MGFRGRPTQEQLTSAVRAEARSIDLDGAIRRDGAENVVLETEQWIFRFRRDHVDFDRELAVLAALGDRLPVTTPRVEWVGERSRFCAYRKITGWRFDAERYRSAERCQQLVLATSLAEYLAAMHSTLTKSEIAELGISDFFSLHQRADLINLNDIPAAIRNDIADLLGRARRAADQVRAAPAVLLQNDVTTDNLVFDDVVGRLCGAWDFSGVSVGAATFDFRYLLREPDPLTDDVVRTYEQLTGQEINREAFLTAARIGDVLHRLRHGTSDELVRMVRRWR